MLFSTTNARAKVQEARARLYSTKTGQNGTKAGRHTVHREWCNHVLTAYTGRMASRYWFLRAMVASSEAWASACLARWTQVTGPSTTGAVRSAPIFLMPRAMVSCVKWEVANGREKNGAGKMACQNVRATAIRFTHRCMYITKRMRRVHNVSVS